MCTNNKIDLKQFLDDFLCENGIKKTEYQVTPFMGVVPVENEQSNVYYFTENNFSKSLPDGGFGYKIVFNTERDLSAFFFLISLQNFIPLSGTEAGKPLTGEIEVDTSNGIVGFYSDEGGNERRINISDDGLILIQNYDNDSASYFEQGIQSNVLLTQNFNTNEQSLLSQNPHNTTLITTDANNNKAEIVVGDYGTVRFNSDIPDDDWSGYMYYNYQDGLCIKDNNSADFGNLYFDRIDGQYNTKYWQIRKDGNDSTESRLLLPASGTTLRRIPVSVNGNYADTSGDITLPLQVTLYLEVTLTKTQIQDLHNTPILLDNTFFDNGEYIRIIPEKCSFVCDSDGSQFLGTDDILFNKTTSPPLGLDKTIFKIDKRIYGDPSAENQIFSGFKPENIYAMNSDDFEITVATSITVTGVESFFRFIIAYEILSY